MHALTIVSFFVVKCSKVWINALVVGQDGTRTMTFIVAEKPQPGTRGVIGFQKGGTRISTSRGHPLHNNAKKRKIPALIMWYVPVTDHLRCIFLNPKEATLMTWWDDKHKVVDDVIAHSVDGS
jgi:hypothetical protein